MSSLTPTNILHVSSSNPWRLMYRIGNSIQIESVGQYGNQPISEVIQFLRNQTEVTAPLLITVDSADCYLATAPNPKAYQPADDLRIELEEQLPLDAEEMLLSSQLTGNNQLWVLDRNLVAELLEALSTIDVEVIAVVPHIALQLQVLAPEHQPACFFIQSASGSIDLVHVAANNIHRWQWHDCNDVSSAKAEFLNKSETASYRYANLEFESDERFAALIETIESDDERLFNAVCDQNIHQFNHWLSIDERFLGNRRNRQLRGIVQLAIVSMLLFVGLINAGLWIAGSREAAVGSEYDSRRAKIYKSLFPYRKSRVAVEKSLKKELKREQKLQPVVKLIATKSSGTSVLIPEVLDAFPTSEFATVQSINYKDGTLKLTGECRSEEVISGFSQTISADGRTCSYKVTASNAAPGWDNVYVLSLSESLISEPPVSESPVLGDKPQGGSR